MPVHLAILQHSLGLDAHGRGAAYRNHFVTGPGSTDYPVCRDLVDQGLMEERAATVLSGGSPVFHVTPAGKAFVEANSPVPPPEPKLTRSQRRYRAYLAADTGLSFPEWLGVSL